MANHLLRLGFLVKFFFFSRWAACLLLFVGIPSAVIGIAAKKIGFGSWEPFFVIGGFAVAVGSVAIYMAIVLMMFPSQLMALVSSRQYGLLPHIRHYLAGLIVCVLLLVQVVAYCILVFGISSDHVLHSSLIVAIMFIVSLMVIISFVQLGAMQFLYFFALPVLGWSLVPQLQLMSNSLLSGILVCLWVAFLNWWFGWHPKKYHKSLFVMNSDELNKQNLSFCGGFFSRGAIPHNLESGILFGQFGNSFYPVRIFLMTLAFTGSIFALMFIFLPHGTGDGLMVGVRLGVGIQIIQIGYNYSLAVFKNINKFWLCFSLERAQLFNNIERVIAKFYLKNLIVITSVILLVSVCVPDNYLPFRYVALCVLASLLMAPLSLYIVFIIYAKWRGNIKIFHWVNGISMALLLGGFFFGLEFVARLGVANYIGYLSVIILAFLGVIMVMRHYAQRLWQHVDLVRVAI